jgi:hypothetical protein
MDDTMTIKIDLDLGWLEDLSAEIGALTADLRAQREECEAQMEYEAQIAEAQRQYEMEMDFVTAMVVLGGSS